MVNRRYVDILNLKFEKDLLSGCGEIYVLMAEVTYPSVLHVFHLFSNFKPSLSLRLGHHKWPYSLTLRLIIKTSLYGGLKKYNCIQIVKTQPN